MKKKILSKEDYEAGKGSGALERVLIEFDPEPVNPLTDWDQVFLVWSNVPDRLGGSPCADNPVGEDGETKEGVVAFPVSMFDHSGIWLTTGGSFHEDPGGWDTTPRALVMYTDKERFEKMCRKLGPGEEWGSAQLLKELRGIADDELSVFQKYLDGESYGWRTEVGERYDTTYAGGRVESGVEWTDGIDSCWGYYADKAADIDFPKEGVDVYDLTGKFVGEEYEAA